MTCIFDKHFVDYFGDYFEGSATWEKQLKNEGLKSVILTDTNVGPESAARIVKLK